MNELEVISLDGFEILDTPLNIKELLDQSQLGHSTEKSNNNTYNDNDYIAEDPYADLPDLIPFDETTINTNTNTNSPIELEYNSTPISNDDLNLDELNRYIESTEDLKFVCLKLAELERLITSKLNLIDNKIHY